jgi:hypothetical protein
MLRSSVISDGLDFSDISFNQSDTTMVLYHGHCPDGFASAMVIKKYMDEINPDHRVIFHGVNDHNRSPDTRGHNVVICDFSFNLTIINKIISNSRSMIIIDHHITAEETLKSINPKYKLFCMNHSGAYLTWRFFFPSLPIPLFIKYIEDNDIWLRIIDYHKEFAAYLSTVQMDFNTYQQLLDNEELLLDNIKTQGVPMWKLIKTKLALLAKDSNVQLIDCCGGIYLMVIVNSADLKSDIGNLLIEEYFPWCDFSLVYHHNYRDNTTKFSFRSTNKHINVEEFARKLNGGGHRNASGLSTQGIHSIPPTIKSLLHDPKNILSTLQISTYQITDSFFRTFKFTIAYLNTPILTHEFIKLMLRKKYTDPHTYENIQVARDMWLEKEKSDCGFVHIGCCYYQYADGTQFIISIDYNVSYEQKKLIARSLGVNFDHYMIYKSSRHVSRL